MGPNPSPSLRERMPSAARWVKGLPRPKFSFSVVRGRRAGCLTRLFAATNDQLGRIELNPRERWHKVALFLL
jgi:hypothetical protein